MGDVVSSELFDRHEQLFPNNAALVYTTHWEEQRCGETGVRCIGISRGLGSLRPAEDWSRSTSAQVVSLVSAKTKAEWTFAGIGMDVGDYVIKS